MFYHTTVLLTDLDHELKRSNETKVILPEF